MSGDCLIATGEENGMSATRETYTVDVAGMRRDLPLFEVAPGLRIAVLNILGDTELTVSCAKELAKKLKGIEFDLLVTPEAKSIPLAHALSAVIGKGYVVLRKAYKPYMGDALHTQTESITTGRTQDLYLDEKDKVLIADRKVVLIDDVISTGSTLNGMRELMTLAGAEVVADTAIFTEGDPSDWKHVIALGNLPLFRSE
jgi:adenine phosphoribosyltransferase